MPIIIPSMELETTDSDPILAIVESFLERSGMTPTAFGVRAMNDPTLVHEMRRGREFRRATRNRIRRFIAAEDAKPTSNAADASQPSEAA